MKQYKEDARFRILNPELYVIEKSGSKCIHYENGRLIYRPVNDVYEIDFTEIKNGPHFQYDSLKINILNDSKSIMINGLLFDYINGIKNKIIEERVFSVFRNPLRLVNFDDTIFISPNETSKELDFFNSKKTHFEKPAFSLTREGAIKYINDYIQEISFDAKLQIRKMSQIMIDKTLGITECIMNEALE